MYAAFRSLLSRPKPQSPAALPAALSPTPPQKEQLEPDVPQEAVVSHYINLIQDVPDLDFSEVGHVKLALRRRCPIFKKAKSDIQQKIGRLVKRELERRQTEILCGSPTQEQLPSNEGTARRQSDVQPPVLQPSSRSVPPNVGSPGPGVNFGILPRPSIDYDWVEDMPAPYPNPSCVPNGVSFGLYLECLQAFCPQLMQANPCTTIRTCKDQGRYFTCPGFRKGQCNQAFSHGELQHSRVNCRARDPTKPCKYQGKSDSALDNSSRFIRVQYAHILPMCRSIKDNVTCLSGGVSGGCRFGHDNVHVRLNVAAERQGAEWAAERAHLGYFRQ